LLLPEELRGPPPSITVADALLDERSATITLNTTVALHRRGAYAITDWNYLGRGRRRTTITHVQTQIVAMPADTFFRDNAN
jgi:hypothetical protein